MEATCWLAEEVTSSAAAEFSSAIADKPSMGCWGNAIMRNLGEIIPLQTIFPRDAAAMRCEPYATVLWLLGHVPLKSG